MYTVRILLAYEYGKYRIHLKALDYNSRYLRFGFTALDEMIDTLCDGFEKAPDEHVLFCVENSTLDVVAVGHVALGPNMELAFSVLKDYQGKGLGQKLMKRCIQWCRTKGILSGTMLCLSHNDRIKHMCIKHGIHIHTECGETQGDIKLDEADVFTHLDEATDRNLAAVDYFTKRARLPWAIEHKRKKVANA
jgi:GNAT superfamily N-acetyltransferase